jgi:hypothetical protein
MLADEIHDRHLSWCGIPPAVNPKNSHFPDLKYQFIILIDETSEQTLGLGQADDRLGRG